MEPNTDCIRMHLFSTMNCAITLLTTQSPDFCLRVISHFGKYLRNEGLVNAVGAPILLSWKQESHERYHNSPLLYRALT
jgi:hypothetical protein